ncbi:MAG: protease inhibitor I42 family protein [Chloroflexi bacterium]|nr:protease inhibitor I42 family protein [Chloroflexota bacterium]
MLKRTLSGWSVLLILLISSTYLTRAEEPSVPISSRPGDGSELVFSLIVRPDGTWEGEARFSTASPPASSGSGAWDAQVQQEAAAIFGGHGVSYGLSEKEGDDHVFSLAGEDARGIVEMALTAAHAVKRLDGPVALDLGGLARAGQTVTLMLTANPSTGYAWGMDELPGSTLFQVNGVETRQTAPGLGVPARQVIQLEAVETGQTDFRLLYHRPWQADIPPSLVISIQSEGLSLAETCAALSAPPPPSLPGDGFRIQEEPLNRLQQPAPLFSAQSLSGAYDWCDAHGGCTSVKDQGDCGSCWAFGTVGPLEALLKAAGQTTDLSEQYLVSCNTSGWNCDGGWFAHDYHEWKNPPSESQAGAVLESVFPYVERDDPCAGPYDHPHKIADWYYVGNSYSIPSVDAIKQAIYDHGPVAAAVCVDGAFQEYGGGIFNPGTSCNEINHAIVLVGWNDTEQTWTLRNSWGPDWGEGGYMRIRYGVSQVGYAANYVVYTSSTPFVASDWVYLPLVLRNLSTFVPGLANGDFESGQDGSWTESSSNGWGLVLSAASLSVSPHGGNWAAWLGGDSSETSILSQQITIPSNGTTLNYWYWIDSEDACGYDHAYVRFGLSGLETYDLCQSNDTGGWVSRQVDVTSWRGQTVELRFVTETDWIIDSSFFLDGVSLSTAP